jgi:hypothetical protein
MLSQGICVMFWGYHHKLVCISRQFGPFYEVRFKRKGKEFVALNEDDTVKAYLGTVRRFHDKSYKHTLGPKHFATQVVRWGILEDVTIHTSNFQVEWSDGSFTELREYFLDREGNRKTEPPPYDDYFLPTLMQLGLDANTPWYSPDRVMCSSGQPFDMLIPGEPLFTEYLLVKIANGHAQIPERMLTDPIEQNAGRERVEVVGHPWYGRRWFHTSTPMPDSMYPIFSGTYKDQNPGEKSKKWDEDPLKSVSRESDNAASRHLDTPEEFELTIQTDKKGVQWVQRPAKEARGWCSGIRNRWFRKI